MKQIGLFFGTFNPFHVGHKIIANYFYHHSRLEEVWFVVSPESPFKKNKKILDKIHRLNIIREEILDVKYLK
ncbi:adenylyltransferase/cytidyltransferase family protein, partial [Bacteroidota bacterium]|nr:adenylyltransferase/cytidyltransferase family protein [Bacteroidota bacterium]